MADVLNFPDQASETDEPITLEPEDPPIELEPDEPLELEPEPDPITQDLDEAMATLSLDKTAPFDGSLASARPQPEPGLVSTALVELLPADFPLPALAKFVPDESLRVRAHEALAYAVGIKVEGAGGLQRADVALTALRGAQAAIEAHFENPKSIANKLHKHITSLEREWLEPGVNAVTLVGGRIYSEKKRLEREAEEKKRRDQEKADQEERERMRREAEAAAKAHAPAEIVESLKKEAETAKAPPLQSATYDLPPLKGSTTVEKWKCRIAETPVSDEPNPDVTELTDTQRKQILIAMRAVLEGRAPIATFAINWKYLNARAVSDKTTFVIPGFEAFEMGSTRAKSSRAR